ncbi:MAG: hypothetical protein IBX70_00360 [Clostridia bacterium]|nr:hypothetical protein [Clostridia bacterium]
MHSIKETDLYKPVKIWLESNGCTVKAEIHDLDVVGMMDCGSIIAVELKKKLNLEVINQAVLRQKIADFTYIAVEHDFKTYDSKRFQDTLNTLRRLEIGLLTINFRAIEPEIYVILEAAPFDRSKSINSAKKAKGRLIKEFHRRSGDYNNGGSTKTKIMTGYREECLKITWLLKQNGILTTKEIRNLFPSCTKTTSLLNQNFFKWYKRVSRGTYQITEQGEKALEEYAGIVSFFERSEN